MRKNHILKVFENKAVRTIFGLWKMEKTAC
jgi:hypothetical protein